MNMTTKKVTPRDYAVGYRRPPRQHQFKPGQSGNPKGRLAGSKNESTILHELLNRKIKVRENGRLRTILVLEGILRRFTEDALKGDIKAALFLLNRYGAMVSGELQRRELSEDDREIIEAFARQFKPSPEQKE
jgi:Family of unknown function (DUF5681)